MIQFNIKEVITLENYDNIILGQINNSIQKLKKNKEYVTKINEYSRLLKKLTETLDEVQIILLDKLIFTLGDIETLQLISAYKSSIQDD